MCGRALFPYYQGESDAELSEDVFRAASVRGHGVEELLDEVVAGSVRITPVHKLPDFRRFRGDLLITGRIGLDGLVGRGYHGLFHEKDKHVKTLARPE